MSKRAEAAAMEAYPPTYATGKRHAKRVQSELVDTHQPARAIFQQGYEQAEKDMIRTVKTWLSEIHRVCDITDENGYRIELRNLIASLEKTLEGE